MTKKAKHTLFRFTQISDPQKISKENKKKYFEYHPDGKSGVFFESIKGLIDKIEKSKKLFNTANKFNGFQDLDELIKSHSKLYEFAVWLANNRSTINEKEVTIKIKDLESLTIKEKIIIWDNLFKECLLQSNPYLRDACMELLIASHFIELYDSLDKTDKELRSVASSTVVIPNEIFSLRLDLLTNEELSSQNKNRINKQALKKYMLDVENKLKIDILKKAFNEIESAEASYQLTEAKQYQDKYIKWEKELEKEIQTNELKVQSINKSLSSKESEKKIKEDLNIENSAIFSNPKFEYKSNIQINKSTLKKTLSNDVLHQIETKKTLDKSTFEEVKVELKHNLEEYTTKIFKENEFSTSVMTEHGVPYLTNKSIGGVDYSYYIKAIKRSDNLYSIFIVLNTGSITNEVNQITCEFQDFENESSDDIKIIQTEGLLILELTSEDGITLKDNDEVIELNGIIEFLGDINLAFKVALDIKKGSFGIMDFKAESNSQKIYIPNGFGITRLGIAEYRKVEQHLCCYVPGEVSHIENIMAREYKERSTRRLRRSETTTSTSQVIEQEHISDTSTTSRFDMQSEISEVLSEQKEFGMHANVNAKYGLSDKTTIGIDVGANYSQNTSKEKSKNEAVNFSKDITQKATDRLVSKVKTERIAKIVEEFEEQNKHGFDNREGDKHISGVYRWIDKIYKNEIFNYGKRTLYEFNIPEPARIHHLVKSSYGKNQTALIKEPKNPKTANFGLAIGNLKSPNDITETNFLFWASEYNADVDNPPEKIISIGESIVKSGPNTTYTAEQKNVIIPEGYGLKSAQVSVQHSTHRGIHNVRLAIAGIGSPIGNVSNYPFITNASNTNLTKYSTSIPISATFWEVHIGAISINLVLERKPEHFQQWQIDTFNAIIKAYNEKFQEYKDAVAEALAKASEKLSINPAFYKELINTIIKKNCIEYLIGYDNLGQDFVFSDGSMQNLHITNTMEMDRYTALVKFMEQAFEWNIMSYMFYPFYWASKNKWEEMYLFNSDDTLFKEFMQAGMARVVVTVRQGFEKAVQYFMKTGLIWNGNEAPTLDDDLFLSIIDEQREPEYTIEETWESRVPSTLTLIQSDSITLEASGLPCYCDEEKPPKEIITHSKALDELNVHINGKTE